VPPADHKAGLEQVRDDRDSLGVLNEGRRDALQWNARQRCQHLGSFTNGGDLPIPGPQRAAAQEHAGHGGRPQQE
jgi:hypothetical protein